MTNRRLGAAAAVLTGLLLLGGCWNYSSAPTTILAGTNMADPGVLYGGGKYHVFSTQWGFFRIPHASATYVYGPYGPVTDALRSAPPWALGNFWAPEAVQEGSYYYLFYSATVAWDGSPFGEHAIGVARSTSPGGPYDPIGSGPVYRNPNHYGAIDPEVVRDYQGNLNLLWSVDWGPSGRYGSVTRKIQGCRLRSDMLGCATGVTQLLSADRNTWEAGTVEAPAMVSGGDGKFHLFYSGGNFEGADGHHYGEGYATCGSTPLSACTRVGSGPWIANGWNGLQNPGGADFILVGFGIYAAVGHTDMGGGRREPRVVYVSWTD